MPGLRDIDKSIACVQQIAPALKTTTTTATATDLSGFECATVLINAGVITDGTHTISLEESDASGSGFTTVTALSGAFTALTSSAGGSAVQEVGYLGIKRYIRVVVTVTGSPSTGGTYGAIVMKSGARTLPQ